MSADVGRAHAFIGGTNSMIDSKPKKNSKTLWANAIVFAIGLLNLFAAQPFIPAEVMVYFPLAIALLNVVLRFVTNRPLEPLI